MACNREAARIEQFARQNVKTITVVGIGTSGSLADAKKFLVRNKIVTTRLFWDESGSASNALRAPSEDAAILVGADGKLVKLWTGSIPYDDVLKRLA